MDTLTGKTRGILLRLPHFYAPEGAGDLLLQFTETFGRALERAETDLYAVLRAHHVQTADNEVTRGFNAPPGERGDLDRILALYLEALGGTAQLVRVSPAFTERSLDARCLARVLSDDTDSRFVVYLQRRLGFATRLLLRRYRVESTSFHADEIRPGFALQLLLAGADGGGRPVAAYLYRRLEPETRALLAGFDGGDALDPRLRAALAHDLNARVLPDPGLYRRHWRVWEALPLPEAVRRLRSAIFRELLQDATRGATDPLLRRLASELEHAETVPTPPGDDLKRLNRMLLDAAFGRGPERPWGFEPCPVPTLGEIRRALVDGFNRLLDDPALWEPRRFTDVPVEIGALRERFGGDLRWLNRTLLEAALPRAVEPSYAPYRERLLALIGVLRRGASTRQGILDIVAANLGIIGDDTEARRARELIRIEEFAPEQVAFFTGPAEFHQEFRVHNPNREPAAPEIRITMREAAFAQLAAVRLTEVATGQSVLFPGRLRAGDRLVLRGAEALVNGVVQRVRLQPPVPALVPGDSVWRFEADVVVPEDDLGPQRERPVARWDRAVGDTLGTFGEAVLAPDEPVVDVEILSQQYHPGYFRVVMPWNIPGFTDKFAEHDHPREQIRGLVHRAKAAGVRAEVAYRQVFAEEMTPGDRLDFAVVGAPLLAEAHDVDEALDVASRQRAREDAGQEDALVLSGLFDTTSFDSLNHFD